MPEGNTKVIRARTDDGKMYLGRVIPEKHIDATLTKLGATRKSEQLSPQEYVDRIMATGNGIVLANGWRIERRQVSGEYRLELKFQHPGDFYAYRKELESAGVFTERINYDTRFFIPTGDRAAEALGKIIKSRPVLESGAAPTGQTASMKQQEETTAQYQEPAETRAEKKTRERSLSVALFNAAKRLNTPARYESLRRMHRTLGTTEKGKIASRDIASIRIMAHEVGHAIDLAMNKDKFLPWIMQRFPDFQHGFKNNNAAEKAMRDELKTVSNQVRPMPGGPAAFDSYRNKATELWADYMHQYILDPEKARATAPIFTQAFEQKLEDYPVVQEVLDELHEAPNVEPTLMEKQLENIEPQEFDESLVPGDIEMMDKIPAVKNLIVYADRTRRARVIPARLRELQAIKEIPDETTREDMSALYEGRADLERQKKAGRELYRWERHGDHGRAWILPMNEQLYNMFIQDKKEPAPYEDWKKDNPRATHILLETPEEIPIDWKMKRYGPTDELRPEDAWQVGTFVRNIRTGKTYEQIEQEIGEDPKVAKALKERAFHIEKERQDVNKFVSMLADDDYIKFLPDYLAHFTLKEDKKYRSFIPRWTKRSPNALHRTLPTIPDMVDAGLTPVSQDFAKLDRMWSEINWQVAVNKRFVFELKNVKNEEGLPVILKPKDAPPGWVLSQHPAIQQIYAERVNGALHLWHGGAAVDPEVYKPLEMVFEHPIGGTIGNLLTAIETMNSISKQVLLSFAFFHHGTLTASSEATLAKWWNPFRGLVLVGGEGETLGTGRRVVPFTNIRVSRPQYAGGELLKSPEFVHDLSMAGLTVGQGSDMQVSALHKWLDELEARTRKVPALGGIIRAMRQFNEGWDRNLWDYYHSPLKAYAYYSLCRELLPKIPEDQASPEKIRQVKEQIAAFLNDAFGGQEWIKKFWLTPSGRRLMHCGVFAGDWTMSDINLAAAAIGAHPEARGKEGEVRRKLAWRFFKNMVFLFLAMTQAANYALVGHSTFENEYGHKTDIDITPLYDAIMGNTSKQRYYLNFKKMFRFEFIRYVTDPLNIIGSKIAMVPRTAIEQITGYEPGSGFAMPWEQDKLSFWDSIPERVTSIVQNFEPISLRGNSFGFSIPISTGMTKYKAFQAYTTLIKGQVDPGWTQKFARYITGDEFSKMAKEVDAACDANGFDGTPIYKQAKSTLMGSYYSDMWSAIKKGNEKEATEYAVVLMGLGMSSEGMQSSGTRRQLPSDQIQKAQDIVDSLPADATTSAGYISEQLGEEGTDLTQ